MLISASCINVVSLLYSFYIFWKMTAILFIPIFCTFVLLMSTLIASMGDWIFLCISKEKKDLLFIVSDLFDTSVREADDSWTLVLLAGPD